MSAQRKVLVTDYAWVDLEEERAILERVGASLVVAEAGEESELTHLAPGVYGILTCWRSVTANVLIAATRCLAVGRYGIGLDNIDVTCATSLGMVVTNVPSYCLEEVSDHAMGLMLACSRRIAFYDRAAKAGTYDLKAGTPLYRLAGKTLGIIGFGKIGRVFGRKAAAFGMRLVVYDPVLSSEAARELGVTQLSLEDLLAQSDFVSIHAPLTPQTRGMFSLEAFRQMKPTAFLINTSRGEIVDTTALVEALDRGLMAGAGLDVYPQEPPDPNDPALRHPRIVATPHAAFNSVESLVDLRRITATQMANVLSGIQPESIVNPDVLTQPNLRARFRR
jgi:D-3-phosphoglycerate dehydrogenase